MIETNINNEKKNLSPIPKKKTSISLNDIPKKRKSINKTISKKGEYSPKRKIISKLNSLERDQIKSSLTTHFLFKDKSPNIIYSLLRKIEIKSYEKDYIIFEEGNSGDFFYIIKEGSVELFSNNSNSKKILKKGERRNFWRIGFIRKKKKK